MDPYGFSDPNLVNESDSWQNVWLYPSTSSDDVSTSNVRTPSYGSEDLSQSLEHIDEQGRSSQDFSLPQPVDGYTGSDIHLNVTDSYGSSQSISFDAQTHLSLQTQDGTGLLWGHPYHHSSQPSNQYPTVPDYWYPPVAAITPADSLNLCISDLGLNESSSGSCNDFLGVNEASALERWPLNPLQLACSHNEVLTVGRVSTSRSQDEPTLPVTPDQSLELGASLDSSSSGRSHGKRLKAIRPKPYEPMPDVSRKRRRAAFNEDERKKVKRIRELGACLRCRCYNEKCDENDPCNNCSRASSSIAFRQPCFRSKLHEVVAYRLSNSDLGQSRATYPKLSWSAENTTVYNLNITYSTKSNQNSSPTLTVACRTFKPKDGARIDAEWNSNGEIKKITLPPVAIYEMKEARAAFIDFAAKAQPLLEENTIFNTNDEILKLTVAEARRYAGVHKNATIEHTLKVRCMAMQTIVLHESDLQIPLAEDPNFMHPGDRPFPTFMLYQLDLTTNEIIDEHKKLVMKQLNKLIFGSNAISAWYEVFLNIYLILSTIEAAYTNQLKYLKHVTGTNWFAHVDQVTRLMLDEWEASAEILVMHFHSILRGNIPFSRKGEEQSTDLCRAGLDEDSKAYIRKVTALLENNDTNYENPDEQRIKKLKRPIDLFSRDE